MPATNPTAMLLFVDNLINIDFSYLDADRGLVGETWLADVELEGTLDEQGMICDFGIVKKTLRAWLDEKLDHRLLIPERSPALRENNRGDTCSLRWQSSAGPIRLLSPESALNYIPLEHIDAEGVAGWCIEQLMPKFPASVKALKLRFRCEQIPGPFYHYSHGLKKHAGNCQRIAHGHRSKIEIWLDETLAENEMQAWAESWRDIYIGSAEDLEREENEILYFSYQAQQGTFSLSLPKAQSYLLPTDSTVEHIAAHIATVMKEKHPGKRVRVKAYEGLAKGAIAIC